MKKVSLLVLLLVLLSACATSTTVANGVVITVSTNDVLGGKLVSNLADEEFVERVINTSSDTQVELTAKPSQGYRFDNWSIAGDFTDSDCNKRLLCSFSPQGDVTVAAKFLKTFELSVDIIGEGRFEVVESDVIYDTDWTFNLSKGETITLKPLVTSSAFVGWGDSDCTVTSQNHCQVTMSGDKAVVIEFSTQQVNSELFVESFAVIAASSGAELANNSTVLRGDVLNFDVVLCVPSDGEEVSFMTHFGVYGSSETNFEMVYESTLGSTILLPESCMRAYYSWDTSSAQNNERYGYALQGFKNHGDKSLELFNNTNMKGEIWFVTIQ